MNQQATDLDTDTATQDPADLSASTLQALEGGKSSNILGSKAWANKVRKRAQVLSKELDVGYMELGKILYEVCATPIDNVKGGKPVFTTWGHETFAHYAEEELGLHRKKAERLRTIWYTLEVRLSGLDETSKKRLIDLGSGKMRQLARVLDVPNAAAWLDLAERTPCANLEAKVKQAIEEAKRSLAQQKVASSVIGGETSLVEGTPFGDETDEAGATPGDDEESEDAEEGTEEGGAAGKAPSDIAMASAVPLDGEDMQFMHFGLFPEQYLIVGDALTRAGELSGSSKKGHNLSMICTDFLATNDFVGGPKAEETRARYLAKIERLLGCRLIAVDVKSKDVVYGLGTLEKLAKSAP